MKGLVPPKCLGPIEHEIRLPFAQAADQVLEIVTHTEQAHIVTALAKRVGDLVLHLRLGRLPGAHLALHRALVV